MRIYIWSPGRAQVSIEWHVIKIQEAASDVILPSSIIGYPRYQYTPVSFVTYVTDRDLSSRVLLISMNAVFAGFIHCSNRAVK